MLSSVYIEKMIILTEKKIEALNYLLSSLKTSAFKNLEATEKYYKEKATIEKAILKVDIEFLAHYNSLLEAENVNAISDIDKDRIQNIKKMQDLIHEVKCIELNIETYESENQLKDDRHSKHTAPRAIEAYKKFKK